MERLKPITMNKSEYMTEKLEDLIEKGTVIKYQKEGSSLINYSIKGTRIRWIEEDEELIEGLNVIRWEWRGKYLGNIS